MTGLLVRSRREGRLRLSGRVVLACGGFEGNAEMLARYIGPRAAFLRPICKGANFNRGDGIRMALDIGAATAGDFGSYHAEPIDPRSGVSEPSVFVFPYGILVNKDGRRFTDEAPGTVDAHYESVTRRIFEQRDGLAYVVLDAKHQRVPNVRLAIRTDKPPIVADSLAALAATLAIPAATLEATVRGLQRRLRARATGDRWNWMAWRRRGSTRRSPTGRCRSMSRRSTPIRSSRPMSSPSAG